jgi:hypothetical protein
MPRTHTKDLTLRTMLVRVTGVVVGGFLVIGTSVAGMAGASSVPGIKSYLLRSGEMPGFVVHGAAETGTGAKQWVKDVDDETGATANGEIRTLRSAGFVAGAYENLRPKHGSDGAGGSTALLFKTSVDAGRDVAAQYAEGLAIQPQGATIHPFKVSIRGARGFTVPGSGSNAAGAGNVIFSAGRCVFVVGDFLKGTHPDTAGPVIAAAKSLDRRVGGICR